MIPGSSIPYTVKAAVLNSDYTFTGWTADPDGSVKFADASELETSFTVNSTSSNVSSITVTANAKDIVAPTVSNFATDGTGLTATAQDGQKGLAYYAFSTSSTAPAEAGWTAVSYGKNESKNAEKTFTLAFSTNPDNGKYYFYAKDYDGNVTNSTNSVQITRVVYNNFYENDAPATKADWLIGSGTVTLAEPTRTGYTFGGWYTDE